VAEIVLDGVTKEYSGGVKAVNDVSLRVEDGEFMVLVGPSGCGKSTLLRIIAGLEETTDGRVEIGGRDVTDLAPRRRDVAMVFQSYALYPHMTVRENLGYGLKVRRTSKAERNERVERVAELLRLEELLDRRPAALSGGQRQRVAMGRAIVREPKAFLMDEPLSNLDAKLRVGMRAQLTALHARLGTTVVYVTHDQVEAMTLGQRVAVMRDGRVQQVETPQRLYADPGNVFVASFIGSPAMNLVEARFDGEALLFARHRLPVPPEHRPAVDGGTPVILGMRPETLGVADEQPVAPTLDVEVAVVEDLGSDAHAIFVVDAPPVHADGDRRDDGTLLREGTTFTARIPAHLQPRAGDRITLAARPERFHYFDVETGEKLPRRSTAAASPTTPPPAEPAAAVS
jgi:multiple sugar transport system ATP-binding protein